MFVKKVLAVSAILSAANAHAINASASIDWSTLRFVVEDTAPDDGVTPVLSIVPTESYGLLTGPNPIGRDSTSGKWDGNWNLTHKSSDSSKPGVTLSAEYGTVAKANIVTDAGIAEGIYGVSVGRNGGFQLSGAGRVDVYVDYNYSFSDLVPKERSYLYSGLKLDWWGGGQDGGYTFTDAVLGHGHGQMKASIWSPVGGTHGLFKIGLGFTSHAPAVPEPETYAMLLAGVGVVACLSKRRKRNQVQ
ncbi:PEP-CTERM sorting domain-containing protein [Chitinivorax sp. B]|uniref:PEP-CTERM sorting domain-containing protein n=1 Tax=Chitinivorax sp. B TaxID=2502235 RepID=UPI002017C479|nr:PEP-CTERM sorting domain-containing protein [Chitinivorax sp. B]